MKKLLLTSVAGILAVSAAGAGVAPYVSVKGGYSNQSSILKLDSIPVGGIVDVITGGYIVLDGLSDATKLLDVRFNTDNVWSFNPAVGIKFDFNDVKFAKFRLEAEYFQNTKAKKSAYVEIPVEGEDLRSVGIGLDYNFKNTGFLMNGYVDFETGGIVKPFISAGVGYGRSELSWGGNVFSPVDDIFMTLPGGLNAFLAEVGYPITIPSSWSSDNLIWSVGVGLSFDVTRNLAIDAQYRYVDYGKVGLGLYNIDLMDIEEDAHQFMLGARYTF